MGPGRAEPGEQHQRLPVALGFHPQPVPAHPVMTAGRVADRRGALLPGHWPCLSQFITEGVCPAPPAPPGRPRTDSAASAAAASAVTASARLTRAKPWTAWPGSCRPARIDGPATLAIATSHSPGTSRPAAPPSPIPAAAAPRRAAHPGGRLAECRSGSPRSAQQVACSQLADVRDSQDVSRVARKPLLFVILIRRKFSRLGAAEVPPRCGGTGTRGWGSPVDGSRVARRAQTRARRAPLRLLSR